MTWGNLLLQAQDPWAAPEAGRLPLPWDLVAWRLCREPCRARFRKCHLPTSATGSASPTGDTAAHGLSPGAAGTPAHTRRPPRHPPCIGPQTGPLGRGHPREIKTQLTLIRRSPESWFPGGGWWPHSGEGKGVRAPLVTHPSAPPTSLPLLLRHSTVSAEQSWSWLSPRDGVLLGSRSGLTSPPVGTVLARGALTRWVFPELGDQPTVHTVPVTWPSRTPN